MTRPIDIQKELAPDPVIADYEAAHVGAGRHGHPQLPHERDEVAEEEHIAMQDRLLRALDGLPRGIQDTDRHGQPGYPIHDALSREPDAPHQ